MLMGMSDGEDGGGDSGSGIRAPGMRGVVASGIGAACVVGTVLACGAATGMVGGVTIGAWTGIKTVEVGGIILILRSTEMVLFSGQ